MSDDIITTSRLELRPWCRADLSHLTNMDQDAQVAKYIYGEPPDPEAHQRKWEQEFDAGWPKSGGIWIVTDIHTREFLGWCGLFPLEDSGLIEIGYRFLPKIWGQGIATEAATAVLSFGFNKCEFDPIVAVTHPENQGSRRVLEKLGFSFQNERFFYDRQVHFFSLEKRPFNRRHGGPD